VSRVIIDAQGHRMELVVPDDKLSLAIGKKGQNVRLASQLTGWRIDIHSESKILELEARAKTQMSAIDGVDEALAETLFQFGWRSVSDLSRAMPDEMAQLPEVGNNERAAEIIAGAEAFMSGGVKANVVESNAAKPDASQIAAAEATGQEKAASEVTEG